MSKLRLNSPRQGVLSLSLFQLVLVALRLKLHKQHYFDLRKPLATHSTRREQSTKYKQSQDSLS